MKHEDCSHSFHEIPDQTGFVTVSLTRGINMKITLIGLYCLLCSLFVPSIAAADNTERIFTVGVVPQFEIRALHKIWRPILNRLEEKTGYRFKLQGSSTIPDFEREFIHGDFDFAYMNPYHLVIANKEAGYIPLVRDHGRKLFGILVTTKTSGITHPTDLNDKTVAFPAPNALGASLQMRQELFDNFGITVIPQYVKNHDSVYLNVLLGNVVAGGGVQKTLNRQKKEYRDNLQIIYKTRPVAPHPFAVLPSVPLEIRNHICEALLSMGDNAEDQALLKKIPIQRIGVATLADYEPLLSLGLERFYKAPE